MNQQHQFTSEQVRELIHSYHARGQQTRPEFCQARGMTVSRFDYYMRRYKKEFGAPGTPLARVAVEPSAAPRGAFALVLANGRRIECGEAELARLIGIAESL
jgi:hypothetical protein